MGLLDIFNGPDHLYVKRKAVEKWARSIEQPDFTTFEEIPFTDPQYYEKEELAQS